MNKIDWDKYKTDKRPSGLGYAAAYDKHFMSIRENVKNVLEIGSTVKSVPLWLDYFENANIFAADIKPYPFSEHERFTYIPFDQYSDEKHNELNDNYEPFDIIIDDGPHTSPAQLKSLNILLPKMKQGSWFVIEDCSVSEKGNTSETRYKRYKQDSEITIAELMEEWQNGIYKDYKYINGTQFKNLDLDIYVERGTTKKPGFDITKGSMIVFIYKKN